MKYLFINSVYGFGSTGRLVADKCRELQRDGHQCAVAYGRKSAKADDVMLYKIGNKAEILFHVGMTRFLDCSGFCSKHATLRFLKWAEEYSPDVIWLHNLHGYYINVEILFNWLKLHQNIQVYWTLHDCWAFTGHCVHFSMAKCDRWKTECSKCPQLKTYPKTVGFDFTNINFKRKRNSFSSLPKMTIITPSKWLSKMVSQSFLRHYQVKVIENRIDTTVFKPVESDFRKRHEIYNKKIILGVSSVWSKAKGLDDFCELANKINDDYQIVLVGITSKQKKNLPQNILCIERTQDINELLQIYTAADVFVNPTHEDTFPTVNLEARACGIPVITYDVGGSPESAGNKYIVKEGDIKGIIDMIMSLTKNGKTGINI